MTKNIKAVLVDDEQKAIDNLTILLHDFCDNITVVGTAKNVDDAIPVIQSKIPDVIFLDIEMPKKSGFELLNHINSDYQVVFVTAYNDYAVKAFDVSAVDYLMKPVSLDRLQRCVSRLENNKITTSQIESLQDNLTKKTLQKITIPHRDSYKVVDVKNILCIEANRAYSMIYHFDGQNVNKYLYSKNLVFFERLFENNHRFCRVHRSWIVNMDFVNHISKTNSTAILSHNIEVAISSRKMKDVLSRMM